MLDLMGLKKLSSPVHRYRSAQCRPMVEVFCADSRSDRSGPEWNRGAIVCRGENLYYPLLSAWSAAKCRHIRRWRGFSTDRRYSI